MTTKEAIKRCMRNVYTNPHGWPEISESVRIVEDWLKQDCPPLVTDMTDLEYETKAHDENHTP